MRRAFTILELLVVIAIMATLMSFVFRLMSVAKDTTYRTETVARLSRLENCLSGYYAAFGGYPPVKVHGTRDIYARTDDDTGQQTGGGRDGSLEWSNVDAACRSQPVAAEFPFPYDDDDFQSQFASFVEAVHDLANDPPEDSGWENCQEAFKESFGMPSRSNFTSKWNEYDWKEVQIFKFGLMSYLLPRYLFMMNGDPDFFGTDETDACAQWSDNNDSPSDPFTGTKFDNGWKSIRDDLQTGTSAASRDQSRVRHVADIGSQSVTARWIPNLEGMCSCSSGELTLFGVNVGNGASVFSVTAKGPPDITFYTPETGNRYVLDKVTVADGWGNEFYYYSPPPYQSYVLWSAGPNEMTFPPWVARDKLSGADQKLAFEWAADDIMQMSN